jgi:alkylation response protein AidB-like acyl-CoA dehydrogenase
VELGVVCEAAGLVTPGAPFLTTGLGVTHALERFGDPALRSKWLSLLASGQAIGTVAFADASSPLARLSSAKVVGGRLTGCKPLVTAAVSADVALVYASAEGEPALVLADLSSPGVERLARAGFDNSRCIGDLNFAEAQIDILLMGEEARSAALDILAVQAVIVAHEQVGGAQACLDRARSYALERKAFGQPIASFQSVKHRIAEMYVLVELARANTIHAAARFKEEDFLSAAAAARLSATEAYDTAARDATQIHGGIGVTWDAALHLHQRRARSLAVELGNSMFWEDLLAGILISDGAR